MNSARKMRIAAWLGIALLAAGAAKGEESDDVGLGERGIGAVGDVHVLRRAVEAEGDVVVRDAGGGVEVDGGLMRTGLVK